MKIEDLDEYQGLTQEMVRGYLESMPPTANQQNVSAAISWLEKDLSRSVRIAVEQAEHCAVCADNLRPTAQQTLRAINRRMLPFPSRAAQEAHNGKWLCLCEGHVVVGRFSRPDRFLHGEWAAKGSFIGYSVSKEDCPPDILFWPCDDYAQRMRWPTDADGNML